MARHIISTCPFCSGELRIGKLSCKGCGTQIDTQLPIPPFFRLPVELQEFVLVFLRCRGNIREAEKALGISYPTVCKKLDLVNRLLGGKGQQEPVAPREVLERVERGEITAAEAAQILRGDLDNMGVRFDTGGLPYLIEAVLYLAPLFFICFIIARRTLGFSFLGAFVLSLVLYAVGVYMTMVPAGLIRFQFTGRGIWGDRLYDTPRWLDKGRVGAGIGVLLTTVTSGAVPLLGVPFVIMLLQKWLGGRATNAERASGAQGLGAWFRLPNVAWAVIVALGLWTWSGFSLLAALCVMLGLLAIYPLATWLGSAEPAPAPADNPPNSDLNAEREQVLRMVEENRVTAEEGAELLNALAATRPVRPVVMPPLTRTRRLVLVGAILVAIGFFLPWFTVNAGREMKRMQQNMSQMTGMSRFEGRFTMPDVSLTQRVSGVNVGHGLGWLVLICAVAAAALPYVGRNIDEKTRRLVTFCLLIAAGAILLYLFTSSIRYVSIGLVLGMVGVGLELAGTIADSKHKLLVQQ